MNHSFCSARQALLLTLLSSSKTSSLQELPRRQNQVLLQRLHPQDAGDHRLPPQDGQELLPKQLGAFTALKFKLVTSLQELGSIVLLKITIRRGQRGKNAYLCCCLWAQERPDLFINGKIYNVISGINKNFKHLFGSPYSKGRSFTNITNNYSEILRGYILAVHTPILSW